VAATTPGKEKSALIELIDIKKAYPLAGGKVEALKGVSLKIDRADIFGVVGYSGAGKSTLIRCVNLLERPDSGRVLVGGEDITDYPEEKLEKVRQKIGMIFQHFNLLRSKTVYENIAFPLRYLRKSKSEIDRKVRELLQLVGLQDRAESYPSQLSGGQKQRVAIARALANDPQILLSDEATSALDPQTTDSILHLLSELNRRLGLTIVIITHEMHVVKEICGKVAVMEGGLVVEQGNAFDVFAHPRAEITRSFAASLFKIDSARKLLGQIGLPALLGEGGWLIHLMFVGENANDAYINRVIKQFDVEVSVIYGSIELIQAKPIGSLFVTMNGLEARIAQAIEYLRREGIGVEVLKNPAPDPGKGGGV
jgi:D-methionine transport system ATP-binding protein